MSERDQSIDGSRPAVVVAVVFIVVLGADAVPPKNATSHNYYNSTASLTLINALVCLQSPQDQCIRGTTMLVDESEHNTRGNSRYWTLTQLNLASVFS